MIVRVAITEKNSKTIYTDPVVTGPDHSGDGGDLVEPTEPTDPTDPTGPTDITDFTDWSDLPMLPELHFELRPVIPDGYVSHRTRNPVTLINVSVPDDDVRVVTGWFSNSPLTGGAASETLLKRATAAVTDALKLFYNDCDRVGLFTRPFKLGYALRLADGRHFAHGEIRTVVPAAQAPLLPITSKGLSNGILQTVTELLIQPLSLFVSSDAFEMPSALSSRVTHLDIYATRQADTLSGDESVYGVSTLIVDGQRYTGWNYRRLSADVVADNAASDRNFRIIASIPIAQVQAGLNEEPLPAPQRNLLNWTNLEILKPDEPGGSGSGGDGDNPPSESETPEDPVRPNVVYKSLRLRTGPLDLELPETRKWVRGLSVRGEFYRRLPRVAVAEDSVRELKVTLYGAHHRGYWHRVAVACGPHIRLARAIGFRWWLVEIEAAADAEIDALTFEIEV